MHRIAKNKIYLFFAYIIFNSININILKNSRKRCELLIQADNRHKNLLNMNDIKPKQWRLMKLQKPVNPAKLTVHSPED